MLDFLSGLISSFGPLLLLPVFIVIAIVFRKKIKLLYWVPRILAILLIITMAMISMDSVSYEPTLGQKINNFFMNNIWTSIPLLIILIISWKYELVGGIGFLLAGLFFIKSFGVLAFVVAIPAFLIGILFIINWLKKRKN